MFDALQFIIGIAEVCKEQLCLWLRLGSVLTGTHMSH